MFFGLFGSHCHILEESIGMQCTFRWEIKNTSFFFSFITSETATCCSRYNLIDGTYSTLHLKLRTFVFANRWWGCLATAALCHLNTCISRQCHHNKQTQWYKNISSNLRFEAHNIINSSSDGSFYFEFSFFDCVLLLLHARVNDNFYCKKKTQ